MDEEEIISQEEQEEQLREQAKQELRNQAQDRYRDWKQQRTASKGMKNVTKKTVANSSGAAVSGAAASGAAASGAAVSGAAVSGAAVSGAAVSGAAVSGAAVAGWVIIAILMIIVLFVIIIIIFSVIDGPSGSSPAVNAYNSGVTITDENGENATTISVEKYVKGAVYAQIGDIEDNDDYIKALSVVFRSYALINYMAITNDANGSLYNPDYDNNSSISSNVDKTKSEYLDYDGSIKDISIADLNKDQMRSLALSGLDYKEVLVTMYGDFIEIKKVSLINTEGLQQDANGFYMRLAKPLRTNELYYEQNANNYGRYFEGECAAYATCRAQEILASINSSKSWRANVNGGNFCNTSDAKKFTMNTDYTQPKVGAIVSWQKKGGRPGQGHVAIVEKVGDNTVTISETFNNLGSLGNSYIRNHGDSASRKANCKENGCFRTNDLTFDKMRDYGGNYIFKCYIYLVEE